MRRSEAVLERLFAVTTVMADAMEADLAARGLSRARATVMARLHRDGPCNQRSLAEALGVTPRNITGLVDGLEAAGLVVHSPHPQDRRALLVSLTDAGSRAAGALAADQRELARFLFASHRAGELDGLAGELDRLLGRLGSPEFEDLRAAARDRWPG